MAQVLTNNTSLAVSIESALGVAGTEWFQLEPNTIDQFGAEITVVERNPISKNRQHRKGITVDLDSGVELGADMTMSHCIIFLEGFVFSTFNGPLYLRAGTAFENIAADDDLPGALTQGYSHDALSAAIPENTLLFARGFPTEGNNGLSVVGASGTTTATPVSGPTLVDETPSLASGATLEVAGRRAATSDLVITVAAGVATLTSTLLDFTTLGWTNGQRIHIGGLTSANQFSAGVGSGRLVSFSANEAIFDKLYGTLATDAGTGDTVDLLFGRFARNVPVDDADFLVRSFQFEVGWDNLDNPAADMFEYSIGNLANELSFVLELADKATMTLGFVGQDTEEPVAAGSRKSGASTPIQPTQTEGFGTSSDVFNLRILEEDETALSIDFKSVNFTLNNNVTPEKVIGFLGGKYMNFGNFDVTLESQLLFTNADIIGAIRNNETLTADWIMANFDGAIAFDVPSMTLGGGDRELPENESVLINVTGTAFADNDLNTSVGISLFPVYPT